MNRQVATIVSDYYFEIEFNSQKQRSIKTTTKQNGSLAKTQIAK
jgi:hypothetical protein